MKKQGILKIFEGMMLIATTTACGSSSAGVKNVDLKDPDGAYHVSIISSVSLMYFVKDLVAIVAGLVALVLAVIKKKTEK